MQGGEKLSLGQIQALLEASQEVRFTGHRREEIYEWIGKTLREHDYARQGREAKGVLRSYVTKMTGQSRAQITRLIGKYIANGEVRTTVYRRRRFPVRYTRADTASLATVDQAHDTLSGPATRKILERELGEYGKGEYERLAGISVAHLYRLRKTKTYRTRYATFAKTKPTPVAICDDPVPSRLTVTVISVSAVLRVISALRMTASGGSLRVIGIARDHGKGWIAAPIWG